MYKPARIDLTQAQIKKAISGKPIRLAGSQIGKGDKVVFLHPVQHRAVSKAGMAGRGCTIELSPAEVLTTVESDMDGTGFFGDLWKGLKTGYNWVKKNVIDTELYQKAVKPLVRSAVNTGAAALSAAIPGSAPLINAAKEKIGSTTGAFGISGHPIPVMRRRIKRSDNILMNDVSAGSFRLN